MDEVFDLDRFLCQTIVNSVLALYKGRVTLADVLTKTSSPYSYGEDILAICYEFYLDQMKTDYIFNGASELENQDSDEYYLKKYLQFNFFDEKEYPILNFNGGESARYKFISKTKFFQFLLLECYEIDIAKGREINLEELLTIVKSARNNLGLVEKIARELERLETLTSADLVYAIYGFRDYPEFQNIFIDKIIEKGEVNPEILLGIVHATIGNEHARIKIANIFYESSKKYCERRFDVRGYLRYLEIKELENPITQILLARAFKNYGLFSPSLIKIEFFKGNEYADEISFESPFRERYKAAKGISTKIIEVDIFRGRNGESPTIGLAVTRVI